MLAGVASVHPGAAQESWSPFDHRETGTRDDATRERGPEMRRPSDVPGDDARSDRLTPPPSSRVSDQDRGVERSDLAPVMANDGSGLPYDIWRGLDPTELERLVGALDLPPRSPTLAKLLRQVMTTGNAPTAGRSDAASTNAIQAEALYRMGRIADSVAALKHNQRSAGSPVEAVILARSELGLGNQDAGCQALGTMAGETAGLPKSLRREAILAVGLCAAAAGKGPAAGLAAELARDEGGEPTPGIAALDAIAAGRTSDPSIAIQGRPSVIDYRLLKLAGSADFVALPETASPALLATMSLDTSLPVGVRLAAAESAAATGAIDADELALVYDGLQPGSDGAMDQPAVQRAILYRTAASPGAPRDRANAAAAYMADVRQTDFYPVAAAALGLAIRDIPPSETLAWFAATAVEAGLWLDDPALARAWGTIGQRDAEAWLALASIADASRSAEAERAMATIEDLGLSGALDAEALHRLVTVLDALDYQIPIPLWDAASRTPQPTGGHLPETGVLPQLQEAARRQEFARTVLLAVATLGSDTADRANILALGDAIRSLRKAGLGKQARRIGFEAVAMSWPAATHGQSQRSEPGR
jgi:hypothetical protein